VESLDSDQQQSLLIELLQDWGGVELAMCMMQRMDNDDNYQLPQGTREWCRCGKCRPMENPAEQVCCKMRPCITASDVFHDTCLNRNVLSVHY